jgi:hypothetical protein
MVTGGETNGIMSSMLLTLTPLSNRYGEQNTRHAFGKKRSARLTYNDKINIKLYRNQRKFLL